jgi:uncharacterized protein (DUF488 family)
MRLYTIGHSTRTLEDFIQALKSQGIKLLVDIRSFPMSRRLPHFNRDNLERELPPGGIGYLWMKTLGGRRRKIREDSPNTGLRNESFRNYADHMLTPEFAAAALQLRELAASCPTAIMCAERMYFQCHRMLVSDYFAAHGDLVLHIIDAGTVREHHMTREAHFIDGRVIYNAGSLF